MLDRTLTTLRKLLKKRPFSDRSEGTLASATDENEVLARLGRIVDSTLNIADVYEQFVEETHRLIQSDRTSVNVIDLESGTYQDAYLAGSDVPQRVTGQQMELEGSLTGTVVQLRRAVLVQTEDRAKIAAMSPGLLAGFDSGFRSMLAVPLISNDEVIGTLHFRSFQPDAYSEAQRLLSERIGSQIAGALANTRLHGALQREAQERDTLARIGRIVSSSLDIDEVYHSFVEEVRTLIPFDRIAIVTVNFEDQTMTHDYVAGANVDLRGEKDTIPLAGTLAEYVAVRKTGIIIDPNTDSELIEKLAGLEPLFDSGLRSFLSVPLIAKDKVIGALHLRSFDESLYTEQHLRTADSVAIQIAGAISNALLFAQRIEAQEALRRSEEEARQFAHENSVIAEIGRAVSSSLDIGAVYERLAEHTGRLVRFDRLAISTIDPENEMFQTAFVSGMGVPSRQAGDANPLEGSFTREVLETPGGLLVQPGDRSEITDCHPGLLPAYDAGMRSFLGVPLMSASQTLGVLHIRSVKENAYDEHDVSLAQQIGNQVAGAIANAQLHEIRLQAEKALAESVERFDLAVMGSAEGIWDCKIKRMDAADGAEYTIGAGTYFSPRYRELLGYGEIEFPNLIESWSEPYVSSEDHERILTALKDHLVGPGPFDLQFQMTVRGGQTRWFAIRGQATWDSMGEPVRMAGSLSDVTEHKELEEQLLHSQKMEAIGQLAGGIAHDFNNLLSAILGYAQLGLMKTAPGSRLTGYLEEIQKAGERASHLTKQLLAFSRRQIIEPQSVNLNDLILNMDRMLRRLISEDIDLITLPADNLGLVKVDPGQIEQVIINLAVNARDAMPGGGRLTISSTNVTDSDEYARIHLDLDSWSFVKLEVADIGIGMSAEVKDRVFEPFFTTKEVGKGTGLGLSTCYGIIRQSGGHITVESEHGGGSTFAIYLPVTDETNPAASKPADLEPMPRGQETVLLVEDELSIRGMISIVLRELGYTVIEAANGEEALEIYNSADSDQIDLLLTDVVMPLLGGKELAVQVKQRNPDTKVLYTSGYLDENTIGSEIIAGDLHFMQKPFDTSTLARKVRDILDL